MSVPEARFRGGYLLRLLASRVRVAFLAGLFLFLWAVAQFHHRETGFSSLLSIGDQLSDNKVTALKALPHHIYEGSPGYDGAYYVQLALHPTLDNPELKKSIDNLPYRAKRILMSWTSWLAGLGQPAWIVQAHALLNVVCWLALGWLLLRWFPPDRWENFLRWAGVMFSHGMIMSVRHSLVDGPSLLLVALALRWLEDGHRIRGAVTLGLAGLGKETSLLAAGGIDFDWRRPGTWLRPILTVGAVALPLAAWMAFIRGKFGPAEDPGLGNFTWPLAGFAEKVGVVVRDLRSNPDFSLYWAVAATMLALAVQWAFFILWWRPADRWWRVGIAFAAMAAFLSTPVWEGYPGASTRVLLPMTLAFNVLVPRGVKWLPLLLAGNLTVATSVFEFSPPHEFHRVHGPAGEVVRVVAVRGWHGPERHLQDRWRWTAGNAELKFVNTSPVPVQIAVRGSVSGVEGARGVRVLLGERLLWGERLGGGARELRFGLTLPPGETTVQFTTDEPPRKVGTDPRDLAFQVANLDIVAQPAAPQK